MSSIQVETPTGADLRMKRIKYLLTAFLFGIAIGFSLELTVYQYLRFSEFSISFASLPNLWKSSFGRPNINDLPGNATRVQEHLNNSSEHAQSDPAEIWKEPTLFNLNFTWIMNNKNICNRKAGEPEDIRLMPILVSTARPHFQERLVLRRSWGSIPVYKKWAVRFAFLLGEADLRTGANVSMEQLQEQEKQLQEEQKKHGDLVMGNFIDTYRNLTFKHLMGYKWILNFCSQATFVLKVDDDIFVDVLQWLDRRTEDLEMKEKNKSAVIPEYYCETFYGKVPIRKNESKWYVTHEEWTNESYPDYCLGWAYSSSVSLIRRLYSVHRDIKFFWIDDVFVTGALVEALKTKYKYEPEVLHVWGDTTIDIADYRPLCESGNWTAKRKFKLVVHVPRGEFFARDLACMWTKTLYDRGHKFT